MAVTSLVAAAALLVTGATGATAQADRPVTLRLAVADFEGQTTDSYVRLFIDEVAERSGGSVTIEPAWNAGSEHASEFERGVANLVVDGTYELGLAGARGWDDAGVTSLQALQAPFLIDDDALAVAVAESPIAADMLAGMADGGAAGLALWPEGLRHLFAWEHCTEPLVQPEQLDGLTVRSIPSGVTWGVIEALGATPVFYADYGADVDACALQAIESQLSIGGYGDPTATGDLVLYTKFQALAANADAFGRLSESQRTAILEAAAVAAEQAIMDRPSEASAALQWCADGGRVVFAGDEGVQRFRDAAQPAFDELAGDAVTGAAIEAIAALKETVEAAPGAVPCDAAALPVDGHVISDTTGFSGELPPNGVYRSELVEADLLAAGASPSWARLNAGTWTMTFRDGTWSGLEHRAGGTCGGSVTVIDAPTASGKAIALRDDRDSSGCTVGSDLVWREDGDALFFVVVGTDYEATAQEWLEEQAAWEGIPHVRID